MDPRYREIPEFDIFIGQKNMLRHLQEMLPE